MKTGGAYLLWRFLTVGVFFGDVIQVSIAGVRPLVDYGSGLSEDDLMGKALFVAPC